MPRKVKANKSMIRAKENYPLREEAKESQKEIESDYSKENQAIIREHIHQDYCLNRARSTTVI
jgi:hypothetical protein